MGEVVDKKALEAKKYRLGEGKDGIKQVIEIPGLAEFIENKIKDPTCHKLRKNETIDIDGQEVALDNSIVFLTVSPGVRHAFMIGEEVAETSRNNILKRAYDLHTGEGVALKIGRGQQDIEEIKGSEKKAAQELQNREEQREWESLSHFNRLRGQAQRKKESGEIKKYMAQEFIEGGDLSKYMFEKQDIIINTKDVDELKSLFHEMFEISWKFITEVEKCHQLGFIHRDIKPHNMIVNKDEEGIQLTLIDFGGMIKASEIDGKTDTDYGTIAYMAPELPGIHNEATDAFAVGKSLLEITNMMEIGSFKKVTFKEPYKSALKELKAIVEGLTHPEPVERITLETAMNRMREISSKAPDIFPINVSPVVRSRL